MTSKLKGRPLVSDTSKCTGCLICELRCSLRFEKAFCPTASAIVIRRLVQESDEYAISFTGQCDNCGICARYCPYGALIQVKKEIGAV